MVLSRLICRVLLILELDMAYTTAAAVLLRIIGVHCMHPGEGDMHTCRCHFIIQQMQQRRSDDGNALRMPMRLW